MWNKMYKYDFILQFLPPTAELLVLEKPYKTPAIVMADLDSDGVPEIAAAYKCQGKTGVILLKNRHGRWYLVDHISGQGYGIDYFRAVPFTGEAGLDLIIGWQVGAAWSVLSILTWGNTGLKNRLQGEVNYSKIEVTHIPVKDDTYTYQIALWLHDTGEAYSVEIYQWRDGLLSTMPKAYPHYFEKMVSYYEKLTAENPDAAFYWYYLADAQIKTQRYEDAAKSIETALKLNAAYPSKKALLTLKSNLLSRQGIREVALYPASVKTVSGTRWGYIDSHGHFVIDPQYDNAMDFQANGLAIVQKGDRSGIIDASANYVVPPVSGTITQFSEGRAAILDDKGFRIIDEAGNIITSKPYGYVGMYQEGRALFAGTNPQGKYLYGYLDRQGREVVPLQYLSGNDFQDGKALVQVSENQFALININGEIRHTYNYGVVGNPGDGLLSFAKDFNSKYGYIDINGNVVLPPQYATALPFSEGRAVVNLSDSMFNQYGLIDRKGNFIIKPQYNDINPLGQNRAAVGKAIDAQKPYLGSIYAIADMVSGKLLTDFIYTNVMSYTAFDNAYYASAATDKNTFFIDRNGKPVKTLPIIRGNGTLSFEGTLIRANVDLRTFYLNKKGKVIWRQNTIIPLNKQYKVIELKYAPNKNYLVYYPQVSGIKSSTVQKKVNSRLKKKSQVKSVDSKAQADYSYTGDFSVAFFRKELLVLQLDGYQFYFGAAHGMPTKIYPHVDLVSGKFYQLKDLFLPGSDYVTVLSDIIGDQIKNDPQYSYVFPDSYKGIKPDQPFYTKEDALYIYFEPYDIAPYAAGFPTFRIPYDEIMSIINTSGPFWKSFH